ncbi:MAG: long-chain-fatty-acid--CoA ligase [Hellea sp.]|nr:long-chain-fatty-acid--CoA ligase [Hellea sp.]
MDAYDQLGQNAANYAPLTVGSFLDRTAAIYPKRQAVVYEDRSYTWSESRGRCLQLASALNARGLGRNDTISVLLHNTPEMFECQFGVPMSGCVLNSINTRLDADTVAYIIDHSESQLFIADRELYPVVVEALKTSKLQPEVIIVDDASADTRPDMPSSATTYEEFIGDQSPDYKPEPIADEWQAMALNYTSGTTGRPKGVVYHHRGAYLMAMGTVASWALPMHPRYLYTVPMFHCNGWGHAWTMTLMAGTIVCLRSFSPEKFFEQAGKHNITHFGGAPIIMNMLASAPEDMKPRFTHTVKAMTAGAPPPASVLEAMAHMDYEIMHVYGLTETYGHVLQACAQEEWKNKSISDQADLNARQGVIFTNLEAAKVVGEDGNPVPHDGESMGEIVMRGNVLMKGYLKDDKATEEAFKDGWFQSGDLGVIYPDGYIQLKDRAKDIIISGGENISSVEVENTLYKHPAVDMAAVVAMPDEKWGEVPCAFVELAPGADTNEAEVIEFCKDNMARFKRPKKVVFGELPKTATGKIQKKQLREQAKSLR